MLWTPPKTAEQNGEIISYTIYANSSDRSFVKFLNVTGNTTTLAVSGLQPYTDYLFMIQAVTVGGRGPYSHPVTNKTFEAGKVFNKVNGILHSLQCLNLFLEPRGDLLLGVIIFFFFFNESSPCFCFWLYLRWCGQYSHFFPFVCQFLGWLVSLVFLLILVLESMEFTRVCLVYQSLSWRGSPARVFAQCVSGMRLLTLVSTWREL